MDLKALFKILPKEAQKSMNEKIKDLQKYVEHDIFCFFGIIKERYYVEFQLSLAIKSSISHLLRQGSSIK